MSETHENLDSPPPKRASTRFLKRFILPSDRHTFVARIYELGIVSMHFDTYEDLAKHPDCKYAFDTNSYLKALTYRVESLNMVGGMLWPDPVPKSFNEFPVSRYEWLVVATDVFLMRYNSVIDCALQLSNQILELGLPVKECRLKHMKPLISADLSDHLRAMLKAQEDLRSERNIRIHEGQERAFTDDDFTFKLASLWTDGGPGMTGHDRYGRKINIDRSFKEGLVTLQRDFNRSTRLLIKQLDQFYDLIWDEFEDRFRPRFAAANHGLNGNGGSVSAPDSLASGTGST
ncbi:MAG: hypothetical protein AAF636_21265 [Pseudomonadota bacterium]